MNDTDFSDETLMRYADGELDEATALAVQRAIEADNALAARAAVFIETRALALGVLKPLADEPVPAALAASVEKMIAASREQRTAGETQTVDETPSTAGIPGTETVRVVQFPAAKPGRGATQWRLPLAASIAAVIGGACGYWLAASGDSGIQGLQVAGINTPTLIDALATAPAGSEVQLSRSGRFRAIATFRNAANEICREFEVDSADRSTVISVACRDAGAWQVKFAVVAPGDDSGYAPASSTEALDAYLTAIEAQPPMPADEEAKVLAEISR